jgi:hypothetical protein
MSEKKERVFADGFSFRKPTADAPEYVVGRLSLKVEEAIAFINANKNANGWVNLSIMIGRSGNPYVELDTYEPKKDDGEPTEVKPKAKPKAKLGNIEQNFQEDAIREMEEDDDELPF